MLRRRASDSRGCANSIFVTHATQARIPSARRSGTQTAIHPHISHYSDELSSLWALASLTVGRRVARVGRRAGGERAARVWPHGSGAHVQGQLAVNPNFVVATSLAHARTRARTSAPLLATRADRDPVVYGSAPSSLPRERPRQLSPGQGCGRAPRRHQERSSRR